ncbi:MAG: dehydrogenase subunit, partial [Firmicutes bacterium]|nr:dehydrogenase subunit [Bacillota bacterium]
MRHLITEAGVSSVEQLAEYVARGGYEGLRKALLNGPAWVVAEMRRAGLRGRGGSGMGGPVADKWARVARAEGPIPRYVVANGAEGSPVSHKDRYLMALFPHRVLEGLLIAAAATGATGGYLYVRGDSEEAVAGMELALAEAREAGLLGSVEVELQTAAARYHAGEETAVIDALEGLEGLPQPKPPRPEETGLHGCPTAVSNVETLAAAAGVLRLGPEAFLAVGTAECPGTALFTVGGDVAHPGVYEMPYGTALAELLAEAGAPARDELLAVLPGGLSSGPLRPDELDVALTYEALAATGSTLGNAAVVVFRRDGNSLARIAAETSEFLAES